MNKIVFDNISCSYGFDGERELIGFKNAKSASLEKGAILVLRGGNGSGKSSFLKTLLGATPLRSGRVRIEGEGSNERSVIDLSAGSISALIKVAYLPQRFGDMFPRHTSVVKVLQMWGMEGGHFVTSTVRRVLYEDLELQTFIGDIAGKHCEQLSGGQAQRLGLVLCALWNPAILLLDEPTAAMADSAVTQVLEIIKKTLALPTGPRFAVISAHDRRVLDISSNVLEFQN